MPSIIKQLSGVVSQMTDSVIITNVEGVIEYVNPAFEDLTGYSQAEVIGQKTQFLRSGRHSQEFYEQMWGTIRAGELFQAEIINRKKNGDLYTETVTIIPLLNEAGQITHYVTTGKDITERKAKETEYRLIAEHTGDVIWLLDVESNAFTFVSPSVEKLRGYTAPEVMKQTLPEVLTAESLERLAAALPQRLAEFSQSGLAKTYTDEVDQFRKDGSIVHTEVTSSFVMNDAGRLQIVGISRDITERKAAARLQETVYRIVEAAQSVESLEELYPLIHHHVSGVMYAENFYIALYDAGNDLMSIVYSTDQKAVLTTRPVPPGAGPTAMVLSTGQPLLFSENDLELKLSIDLDRTSEPGEVWLGVPLIAHGQTIGVMAVQHYTDPNAYTERDQRILEFVSSQVATAIERKQSEEAVRLVEKRNAAIIANAPDGIMMLDAAGKITFGSPSAFRLLGYSSAELIGGKLVDLISPDDQPQARRALLQVKGEPGETFTVEYRFLHREGSYRWLESVYSNLLSEPSVKAVVVNFRDITERKQTEAALHTSEELYRSLINSQDAAISTIDAAGVFHYMNQIGAAPFADSAAEIVGHPLTDFFPPPVAAQQLAMVRQVIASGEGIVTEYKNEIAGKPSWRRVSVQPVRNAAGQVDLAMVNSMDITEHVRAVEQLRDSELRLKQAQQIAQLGSWELDLVNNQLTWSDEIYRIFGLQPQEFAATYEAFLEAIHPDDRDMVDRAYSESLQTQQPYEIVHRLLLSDGTLKYVREKCETTYNDRGEPVRSLGTVQDITAHRQMELAIEERVKELTGLFAVSRLLEDHTATEADICERIVELLPPAMQYPELAVPAIELNSRFYSAPNYSDTLIVQPCLTSVILVNGEVTGWLSVYYVQDKAFILPEEQELIDNITRMLGLWLEQREAEAAMHASEERFRQLADNIQEGFWLYDRLENRVVYLSPAYANIWGYPVEELYRNPDKYLEAIVPEDRPLVLQAQAQQPSGTPVDVEYRLQRPDGSVRWIWDRSFPIFDEDGQVVRIAGVVTDITNEQLAKLELEALNRDLERRVEARTAQVRQNEATYRALFENSNDGIFLISPDGKTSRANQRALDMIGYTWDEYQQLEMLQTNPLTPQEQQQDATDRFEAVLRGEQVPLYERTFITKAGASIAVEVNLSAIRNGNSEITMVQSVVRDISQRKKAEAALRDSRDKLSAANAALEKASRLKDEFLASMSHELRTPLTGILGLAEVLQLQAYGELNAKQEKAIDTIASSGRHLLELINDILDLSKIEAGKLDLQLETCALADICQASLQLTKGMAHQKQQQIGFTINPVSVNVKADARRLKQMLVNLLSNAVKFTPNKGQLGLEVQGDEAEQLVYITVWDKGIGIGPEEMSKLFKPFTQLDSSLARQHAGTGLGLSLVQRMAELHGGSIQVDSAPDEGSRFTIVLPWLGSEHEPEPALTEADYDHASQLQPGLVIEDNTLDAEQVSRYLQDIGVSSITHSAVAGALEQAARLRPGVILLDLTLPDGSGLALLAQLKADERTLDIPVIITSVAERRSEASQLGAAGYLLKPFSRAELQTMLAKVAIATRPAAPVMVITPPNANSPIVMLTDDNEVILETVSDFLQARGYRVTAARSGLELLDRVVEVAPDIILVDIQMPGMDGMEAIRRLRAHSNPAIANTPIIAVTALAMTGDREKCLQAGANEYMSKPIVLTQLDRQIRQLLKK